MNKLLVYLASLLILAMATALAVSAQEINATMDAALNNATINSSIIDEAAIAANNATAPAEARESSNISAINLSSAKEEAQNLSTADSSIVAPISQMALPAPLVAAGASSIQTAAPQEGTQKIGAVVNDANRTVAAPSQMEPLEVGLPAKPIKDVSTIFFVCDLV
ncbi:MAG: hypothetical protein LUQ15_04710 [Methanothrix sp.]|nr:hypothetical protein [Methanothrix sp.]OYV08895.1 MAG: hypothetical protein CG437_1611 [Methanosaeta sp. NSP1]